MPGFAGRLIFKHCSLEYHIDVYGESYNKFKDNLDKIVFSESCYVCGKIIDPKLIPLNPQNSTIKQKHEI